MKVIGIAGKMGVGKTAISLILLKSFPTYQRSSFGDLLKQEISKRFNVRIEELYQNKSKMVTIDEARKEAGMPGSMTMRQLLQWYGTDVVRAKDQNYWVNQMHDWFRLCETRGIPGVIIDDVRFPNEANFIKRWHGVLVHINPYPGYTVDPSIAHHSSETALEQYKGFDAVYSPGYGEEELQKVAQDIVRLAGNAPVQAQD